jgi:long-subunit acyl-CoA synthetase (AMP-forming)
MTPTQKIKRSVINERYADLFERMYDGGERA